MRAPASWPSAVLALVAAALLAGTVACAAGLRRPTEKDAQVAASKWPGTTLEDLQRGRALYVRRCSGCHTLYLPSAYGAEVWPELVDSMSRKARLSRGQQVDITRFVVTVTPAPSH